MKYDPQLIESQIQAAWQQANADYCNLHTIKPKYYVLDMFPYPSGHGLHVGHLKGYIGTDVFARYKRLNGFEVLHPMGWDSFGLPTERQAERDGISPQQVTSQNVAVFKDQLMKVGIGYDWSKEITTSEEPYFKWTQWIFLKLYENGLAYQSEVEVNWCPALGTVLANEEVLDGKYIETGDQVVKRKMTQWMLKITAYADRLIDDLDLVDWPESVKEMQRNWIGRSYGLNIKFCLFEAKESIEIFTTRPETLFGASFVAVSPGYPNLEKIVAPEKLTEVNEYIIANKNRNEKDKLADNLEKTGVFTGFYVVNPVNNKKIPVWVSDFVLSDFGSGIVFGCPGHDKRDYDFAVKFNLEVTQVINAKDVVLPYVGNSGTMINSEFLNGLTVDEARGNICQWLVAKGSGEKRVCYKLRDWLFSRQRYWGEPIPMVYDEANNLLTCHDLPIMLPKREDEDSAETNSDNIKAPLDKFSKWKYFADANGRKLRRETNVMPQWAGSSWYYLRYLDPQNQEHAWSKENEQKWLPVDMYVGGVEHATLHLLYARFWHKFFYDIKLTVHKEPFKKLCNQGMVHARSFKDVNGKYYYPHEVQQTSNNEWITKNTHLPLISKIEKMSKSKYNVANPNDIIQEYGADSLRLYEMFIGPFDESVFWDTNGIIGCRRFLDKVWDIGVKAIGIRQENDGLNRKLHKLIKNVTLGMETMHFNTVVSFFMQFINDAKKEGYVPQEVAEKLMLLLAPFTPHIAEEFWQMVGKTTSVFAEQWPDYIEEYCIEDVVTVAIQINGKVRASLTMARDLDDAAVKILVLDLEAVKRHIDGQSIKKTIVVKNKIVNIVI